MPQRAAGQELAPTPALQIGMEERTKTVRRPSPKRTISKRASPRPMAAEPQPRPETGKRVVATTSKTSSFRLAVPRAAQERPSCGGNQSTTGVPAGGAEEEGASWVSTPRPSAGRPERPADDPQRKHRGGLCGGPEGQPRNHKPRSKKPHSARPTGERVKVCTRPKKTQNPSSSR